MNDELPDLRIFEEIKENLITNQRLVTKLEALENKITHLSVLKWSWSVRIFWMVIALLFIGSCAGGVYYAIQWQLEKPPIIQKEIEIRNIDGEISCRISGGSWNYKPYMDLIGKSFDTKNYNWCIHYFKN